MVRLSDIATVEKLMLASKSLNISKRPGFDGQTVHQLRAELIDTDLAQLTIEALIRGSFKPAPLLEKQFPKPNSDKMRTIYVPCVSDKAIQVMVIAALEPITEARFHPWSYGFRPGGSIQRAVMQASDFVKDGYPVCLMLDLENFFGLIDRERLRFLLRQYGLDSDTRRLINAFIRARIVGDSGAIASLGIPAGIPLAPMLANMYLHPLDQYLASIGVPFVRFADDIALFFKTQAEGQLFRESFATACKPTYGVQVNDRKTQLVTKGQRSLLGFQVDNDGRITASAAVFDKSIIRLGDLLTGRSSFKVKGKALSLAHGQNFDLFREQIVARISGVLNCYRIAENFDELLLIANEKLAIIRHQIETEVPAAVLYKADGQNVRLDESVWEPTGLLEELIGDIETWKLYQRVRQSG